MKSEPDKPVTMIVTHSKCALLKKGDTTCMNGPMIDYQNSSATCVTALLGIYPWVMASRFGIESKNMEWNRGYHVWCPEKLVKFKVVAGKEKR
jgi:uncharacterized repeat protein (TIGR04076 family)